MKTRTDGFLSDKNISHASEHFDYIAELHGYLWRFIGTQITGASGRLENYLDAAVEMAERKKRRQRRITHVSRS